MQASTAEKPAVSEKPEEHDYDGVVKGKYNWGKDIPNREGADEDVVGRSITKYSWADGKKTVSVYVEIDGLDAVPDDALMLDHGAQEASLTIFAVGTPPRKRVLRLPHLAHEIEGAKLVRKPGRSTVTLRLAKKEEKDWPKLLGSSSAGFLGGSGA
mmetsp:Transcript_109849/g.342395  ORF Transcript_109849/g.342395 Transcript_109849/m.342395 type:complete len:156 (+) Transcript_109849:95-562(+)